MVPVAGGDGELPGELHIDAAAEDDKWRRFRSAWAVGQLFLLVQQFST